MRSTFLLPALGATALVTALVGVVAVPLVTPDQTRVTAQNAVSPTLIELADEQSQVAERKAHARATAAAAAQARAEAARAAAAKAAAEKAAAERAAATRASRSRSAAAVSTGDPRGIARAMLAAQGQAGQFGCLDKLWTKESGWRVNATNPSSGAYGIPQSLPAGKMASAGSDWRTNARTQIRWGLGYINGRYGSPCAAWQHSQAKNWY